jgi:multidrug transporter EmrE-like cation transporter
VTERDEAAAVPGTPLARFLNPYVQIGVGAVLTCVAELLLKKGAISATPVPWLPEWLGAAAMTSGWTWLGIVTYVGSFLSWLRVLRLVPLNIAYSLVTVAQVLVPMGAAVVLHEHVSALRWVGIAFVLAGVMSLISVAAAMERDS